MPALGEILQAEARRRVGRVVVDHAHQVIGEQHLGLEVTVVLMKVRAEADHQVDAPGVQVLGGNVTFEFVHIDGHRQVDLGEALQQARQDQLFEILRGAEVEGHGPASRVERLDPGMAQVDALDDLQHMGVHAAGPVGRPHAGPGVDEQLVLEAGAQFLQAVTHGGLADAQGVGHAADIALFIHRDEHHEVLHIELAQQVTVEHPSDPFSGVRRLRTRLNREC